MARNSTPRLSIRALIILYFCICGLTAHFFLGCPVEFQWDYAETDTYDPENGDHHDESFLLSHIDATGNPGGGTFAISAGSLGDPSAWFSPLLQPPRASDLA
jgi:hypothetical protein